MTKYHLNLKTGEPRVCKATQRSCPVADEHFETQEDAAAAFETIMREEAQAALTEKELAEAGWDEDEAFADAAMRLYGVDLNDSEEEELSSSEESNVLERVDYERGLFIENSSYPFTRFES